MPGNIITEGIIRGVRYIFFVHVNVLEKATLLPLLKLHIANSLQCPLRNPPEYSLLPVCLNLYVTFNITVTEQFRDIFHPDKLLQILLLRYFKMEDKDG